MNKDKEVIIAGVGPGSEGMMTAEVRQAADAADVIIGAARMTAAFLDKGKKIVNEYRSEEIAKLVKNTPASRFLVLVSGDPGIFSAGPAVYEALSEFKPRILPGISSVSALCSAAGVRWEDARIISAHGRNVNIASEVRRTRLTCVLTDKNAGQLLAALSEYGLGQVRVVIGQHLSYEDEKLFSGTAEELMGQAFDPPLVMLIENGQAKPETVFGMADEEFIRGRVPMTKRAVRAVTMSMLQPQIDSIIYDIGAGTGSVSVEAAHGAWRGSVFAVEHKAEAAELIRLNARKHAADNIVVVEGHAPEALMDLPAPDRVFIGGSGGNMSAILDQLVIKSRSAGKAMRLVINAVSMETIASAVVLLEKKGFTALEYTQLSVSVSSLAGSHHLMKAENPVFIIKADLAVAGTEKTAAGGSI